jgi:hypothetical protein
MKRSFPIEIGGRWFYASPVLTVSKQEKIALNRRMNQQGYDHIAGHPHSYFYWDHKPTYMMVHQYGWGELYKLNLI